MRFTYLDSAERRVGHARGSFTAPVHSLLGTPSWFGRLLGRRKVIVDVYVGDNETIRFWPSEIAVRPADGHSAIRRAILHRELATLPRAQVAR